MKVHIYSDLHGDIDFIRDMEYYDGTFVIAGDLHEVKRYNAYHEMISVLCSKAKKVLLVPGNHEYYGSNIHSVNTKLKAFEKEFDNFVFLNDNAHVTDEAVFIGSTLWTDFDSGNPMTMFDAQNVMNDYKFIRHGPVSNPWRHKLKPYEVLDFHRTSKEYIRKTVRQMAYEHPDKKIIVVTHHSPSFSSTPKQYFTDSMNGCYSSNLDYFITNLEIDCWIHGHIHNNSDYMIDKTRVICNPYGYNRTENPSFKTTDFDL